MDVLGINPILLLAQLISFTTLALVLNHFLYKKIRQALRERREMVASSARQSEEISQKLAKMDQEREDLKKKNQEELKTVLAEAKTSAEQLKQETLAETDSRAKKILEEAQAQVGQEYTKASETLRLEATKLAREMVERFVSDKKNKTAAKLNLERSISELKNLKHE